MDGSVQCVWFKRDLRVRDHGPLTRAAQSGLVVPIYIIEPEIINSSDFDALHWQFIRESLIDLQISLKMLGSFIESRGHRYHREMSSPNTTYESCSFEQIRKRTGLSESDVIKIMRHELKLKSFRHWRSRVNGRITKHRKRLRSTEEIEMDSIAAKTRNSLIE